MWSLPLLYLLLLANSTFGSKHVNVHKIQKASNKSGIILNDIFSENRNKRSLISDDEKAFLPINTKLIDYDLEDKDNKVNSDLDQPFWGMRGRRESSEEDLINFGNNRHQTYEYSRNCKSCFKSLLDNTGSGEETLSPFWGNRGRRNSEEIEDNGAPDNPFWGNRGRREEEEPFWGTRGRRNQELPLGIDSEIQERTQLKNRKKIDVKMLRNRDEAEPFWGSRGRRRVEKDTTQQVLQEGIEPFWGSRGRRENKEPFWGNRGRRKDHNSNEFKGKSDQFTENSYGYVIDAMKQLEDELNKISGLQRSDKNNIPFRANKERENKLQDLFNGISSNRLPSKLSSLDTTDNFDLHFKPSEPETVRDDRIFAEQPHYILVERSSRSSAEDDPFFISRGKKFNIQNKSKIRDRRGALEELVKSVRNDPYYIARGKKLTGNKNFESLIPKDKSVKAVELICSTVGILPMKDTDHRVKREIKDNERDRRNTLKKLAAQLKADPYFVSRGKKNGGSKTHSENVEEFINQVAAMCN